MIQKYLVSIYKDDQDNVLIIPYARNGQGICTNINQPQMLKPPYAMEQLGVKTKEAFDIAIQETDRNRVHVDVAALVTGIKSDKKFNKKYLYVHAHSTFEKYNFYPGVGVTSDWDTNKGYSLPGDAANEEIGTAIMNTFELHRLSRL